ncbi:MAG: ankyrin repeat domain-containing protein [Chloroflexi bacterium]|nr:ankyrin repeat domain-containing protein [Chloroflexota bacterium]
MRNQIRSLYDQVGGMEGCRRLSERFHERVAANPVLSAVFPAALAPAVHRLALFIAEQTGGPAEYTARRGKQSLVCRHAHVPIASAEMDAWLREMSASMEECGIPADARTLLESYFSETAATVADPLLPYYSLPLPELQRILPNDPGLACPGASGRTLLSEAAGRWDVARVQMLIGYGGGVGTRDGMGHDALYRAVNALNPGREDDGRATVTLLIEHGADVNGTGGIGKMTPLHMAARRGNAAIAEILLDSGADIEAKDTGGETPLRRAVNCRQESVVRLLLSRGADPLNADKRGITPLDAARPGPIRDALAGGPGERPTAGAAAGGRTR